MAQQNIFNRPNRSFHIEAYNPNWAKQYRELSSEIKRLLGPEIIRVEHIGSTSVPGMVGKPQIDVLVEVHDLAKVKNYYKDMQAAGYKPLGDYVQNGEEFFAKDLPDGSRLASVHVLPTGHLHIMANINFRDYLRSHPDEVTGYSRAKQIAFDNCDGDYNRYFKNKSPYVEALVRRAEEWSRQSSND